MALLENRDDIEARLLQALGRVNASARRQVLAALGDPPDVTRLTADLLREIEQAFGQVLFSELEKTFLEGAQALAAEVGIGVDWDVVNQRAADWARQYSSGLAHDLGTNSDRQLRAAVADFFEERIDNRTLTERIGRIYGPNRASTVAITEVTRAAVEGERAAAREIEATLAQSGLRLVAVWQTVNDAGVCPVCEPRNGSRYGDGWTDYPPAHARCRCWISHEVEGVP